MDLKILFTLCSKICDKHIDKNPEACISLDRNKYSYTDIKQALENVKSWCYPIDTASIKKVTLCSNCKHYQEIKNGKVKTWQCDKDNTPKSKDHYCGYGEELVTV